MHAWNSRLTRNCTSNLWIRDGNGAGVLLLPVPAVLDAMDLGVVGLHVGHVLPSRRPPEPLARGEHLLWKEVKCEGEMLALASFNSAIVRSPSYTQSGMPLKMRFSTPVSVTCCHRLVGLTLTYRLFFQTKA